MRLAVGVSGVLFAVIASACGPAMDPASPPEDAGMWLVRETPGEIGVAAVQPLGVVELHVDPPRGEHPDAQLEIDGIAVPWDVVWGQPLHIAIGAGEHDLSLYVSSSEGSRSGQLSIAAARGCRLSLRAIPVLEGGSMRFQFDQSLVCRGASPATAIPPPQPAPTPPGASDRVAVERWLRERHDAAVNAVSYVGLAHGASVAMNGSDACLASALAELRAVERSMREQRGASGEVERQLHVVKELSGRLADLQALASTCS